ncbi:uncharacterized protein H6S33_008759 [Morchella sextelata]|uniref:uncharacterized protein n=1 Tax=Morchella sextelata TaxID=1174677 RepID=UPI001D04F4A7|nr:uncharacterized protein H6S33_008759 [Morchella sextelata]KAH0602420.1 hypothetical protein H6S33_008759 [Morchella sextelata]
MAKDRSVSKDKKEKKDKKDKKEKKSKDIISPVEDDTTKVSKSSKKEKKDKKAPKTEGDAAEALLEALVKNDEETKSGEGTSRGTVASAIISEVTKAQGPLSDLLVPFAKPLADEKLSKKVLKTVKKASKNKSLKRGVKEVVKALRKAPTGTNAAASTGLVVLAADISPMDVISHIPVLCEDHNIPYIFVTSRAELGAASSTKRPTSVVMIVPGVGGGKDKKKKSKKSKDGEDKMDVVEEETDDGFREAYDEAVKLVEAATISDA